MIIKSKTTVSSVYTQNVENEGIEPSASCVQGRRSTPELIPHWNRNLTGLPCGLNTVQHLFIYILQYSTISS